MPPTATKHKRRTRPPGFVQTALLQVHGKTH